MRLSRLGTDSSLPPDYQGFRAASELGRSILAAGQVSRAVAGPPPTGVVRRPFKEPPLTAESSGATRAALLAMRAHRGTGSSNPLPSSGESDELPPSALRHRRSRSSLRGRRACASGHDPFQPLLSNFRRGPVPWGWGIKPMGTFSIRPSDTRRRLVV